MYSVDCYCIAVSASVWQLIAALGQKGEDNYGTRSLHSKQ